MGCTVRPWGLKRLKCRIPDGRTVQYCKFTVQSPLVLYSQALLIQAFERMVHDAIPAFHIRVHLPGFCSAFALLLLFSFLLLRASGQKAERKIFTFLNPAPHQLWAGNFRLPAPSF